MTAQPVTREIVSAFVRDGWLPNIDKLVESLRHSAGRRPSPNALRVAGIVGKMDGEDAAVLVRDVVDATTFGMLYLMGADFKNAGISVSFHVHGETYATEDLDAVMTEEYRALVDPGGLIVADPDA